jgi:hypothetical protein
LFFWLQPLRKALADSGYTSGVVFAFSTKTPITRRSIAGSGFHRGEVVSEGRGGRSLILRSPFQSLL